MSSPAPSSEDFDAAQWQDCLSGAPQRICWTYPLLFGEQAKSFEASGDELSAAIFTRLRFWTALRLNENGAQPFPEALLDAISEQDFALLRELAPVATDAELRARLADLAWQGRINRRRDPEMAKLAIAAYLQSSQNFADEWWEQTKRIERALQLALGLGRQTPEIETVWLHIEAVLAQINSDDEWFASAVLMEIMQQYGRGDATTYAPMAERAALKSDTQLGIESLKERASEGSETDESSSRTV